MLLEPTPIGAELVFLTREEAAFVEVLQHTRSVQGGHKARADWLAWVKDVAKIPAQKRRLAAGRALMFTDQDELDLAAELERRRVTDACAMHVFDCHGLDRKNPPLRLKCVMCTGSLPTMEAGAYAAGFAAAGGDPETVIEGYGR